MTESQWIIVFVARMINLRGDASEPEAIRLMAAQLYPVFKDVSPGRAAEEEFRRNLQDSNR